MLGQSPKEPSWLGRLRPECPVSSSSGHRCVGNSHSHQTSPCCSRSLEQIRQQSPQTMEVTTNLDSRGTGGRVHTGERTGGTARTGFRSDGTGDGKVSPDEEQEEVSEASVIILGGSPGGT